MGLSQKQAVLLMYVISGCLGISAIALTEVSKVYAALILLAIILVAFFGAKKIGVLNINDGVLKSPDSLKSH